ncbi:DUF6264 family protein [uncultured Williamsia sp.]|uniref:DUF6264 family protein n=1 Tax=uncultured Williamsia sp. TaxID=259311 RepID=UPI002631D444|nr:DUF6264 family protein [uncultured Williamsia sp.]
MSTPFPYSAPVPQALTRRPHTADVVVTSLLIAAHVTVFGAAAFFSLFYAMASDPCGSGTVCDTGKIGQAFFLTDAVGLVVLLAASTGAVLLMLRRRIAFWVPLLGVAAQVGLVALSFGLLDQVVP